jgi:hypothetical protein
MDNWQKWNMEDICNWPSVIGSVICSVMQKKKKGAPS